MNAYHSLEGLESGFTSSLWKHVIVICFGIIVALVTIFGIKAVGADSPEGTKALPAISLDKEFCSEASGICFNYPNNWEFQIEKQSSKDSTLRWGKYNIHFEKGTGNETMVIQDYLHNVYSKCLDERMQNLPPLHILETAQTKLTSVDPDVGNLNTYAIKDIFAEKQADGSLKYEARMYLTQFPHLFKPGKLEITCDMVDMADVVSVNGTLARITIHNLDKSSGKSLQFNSYEEALQAFNKPIYQEIWKTIQSAHTK